jgi:hypothetical protein
MWLRFIRNPESWYQKSQDYFGSCNGTVKTGSGPLSDIHPLPSPTNEPVVSGRRLKTRCPCFMGMARLPRLDLPDVPQNIIQRGNNRYPAF